MPDEYRYLTLKIKTSNIPIFKPAYEADNPIEVDEGEPIPTFEEWLKLDLYNYLLKQYRRGLTKLAKQAQVIDENIVEID
jgi:hypothetical protein